MVQSIYEERCKLNNLLALCLKTGDQQHWNDFAQRSNPVIAKAVVTTMRRATGKVLTSLVDDLVQDTYVKLCANDYRPLREFKPQHEHAVYGFLKAVAANVVQDYFRASLSQKRGAGSNHVALEALNAVREENTYVKPHLEQQIVMGQIRRLLANREGVPNYRRDCAIFWLYYRYGVSSKAIAQIEFLDLTVKGVESTLGRLTRDLKRQLSGRYHWSSRSDRSAAEKLDR